MHRPLQRWLRPSGAQSAQSPACTPALPANMAQRCASLAPFPVPDIQQSLSTQPLLVFDLETTGLDLKRDQLLSAGAIRIDNLEIVLGQTYERVFNVETNLPRDSQLFHGLTTADLQQGDDPCSALLDLLEHGQDALWLAWKGWFDQHMLHKAAQQWLGLSPSQ